MLGIIAVACDVALILIGLTVCHVCRRVTGWGCITPGRVAVAHRVIQYQTLHHKQKQTLVVQQSVLAAAQEGPLQC